MKIFDNSIDIYEDFLVDSLKGKVIFFCGSGVSRNSGLPDGKRLIEEIVKKIGISQKEEKELSDYLFDQTCKEIEEKYGRREYLRNLVQDILKEEEKVVQDIKLDTQKAILELSKNRNKTQLITTNFDTLFEKAHNKAGLRKYVYPKLPSKISEWNGIVYLHGSISNPENMILTTSDFAREYIGNNRIRDFLKKIASRKTLCFIGYSFKDTMMAYLLEILDKKKMYAFLPIGEKAYVDKNIRIIRYSVGKNNNHYILHETIKQWAGVYTKIISNSNKDLSNIIDNPSKENIIRLLFKSGKTKVLEDFINALDQNHYNLLEIILNHKKYRKDQDGLVEIKKYDQSKFNLIINDGIIKFLNNKNLLIYLISDGINEDNDLINKIRSKIEESKKDFKVKKGDPTLVKNKNLLKLWELYTQKVLYSDSYLLFYRESIIYNKNLGKQLTNLFSLNIILNKYPSIEKDLLEYKYFSGDDFDISLKFKYSNAHDFLNNNGDIPAQRLKFFVSFFEKLIKKSCNYYKHLYGKEKAENKLSTVYKYFHKKDYETNHIHIDNDIIEIINYELHCCNKLSNIYQIAEKWIKSSCLLLQKMALTLVYKKLLNQKDSIKFLVENIDYILSSEKLWNDCLLSIYKLDYNKSFLNYLLLKLLKQDINQESSKLFLTVKFLFEKSGSLPNDRILNHCKMILAACPNLKSFDPDFNYRIITDDISNARDFYPVKSEKILKRIPNSKEKAIKVFRSYTKKEKEYDIVNFILKKPNQTIQLILETKNMYVASDVLDIWFSNGRHSYYFKLLNKLVKAREKQILCYCSDTIIRSLGFFNYEVSYYSFIFTSICKIYINNFKFMPKEINNYQSSDFYNDSTQSEYGLLVIQIIKNCIKCKSQKSMSKLLELLKELVQVKSYKFFYSRIATTEYLIDIKCLNQNYFNQILGSLLSSPSNELIGIWETIIYHNKKLLYTEKGLRNKFIKLSLNKGVFEKNKQLFFDTIINLKYHSVLSDNDINYIFDKLRPEDFKDFSFSLNKFADVYTEPNEERITFAVQFIRDFWPKKIYFNYDTNANILLLAASSKNFPKALKELEWALFPTTYTGYIIRRIKDAELYNKYPTECIKLLHGILGPNSVFDENDINDLLDKITMSDKNLLKSLFYINLLKFLKKSLNRLS